MAKVGTVGVFVVALFGVASVALGQESKSQQKCISTLNKDMAKVAATQGKNDVACVKAATKGSPSSTCVPDDNSGKVAGTETKASGDETKNGCLSAPNAPDFGYSGVNAGTTAAVTAEINLFADMYGTTDTTGVIKTSGLDAKCQAGFSKDIEKGMATMWKSYLGCKKTALATATDNTTLETCVQNVKSDQKVNAVFVKVDQDGNKNCGPTLPAGDFPGRCSAQTTPGQLDGCMEGAALCRLCLALNTIDGLSVDCNAYSMPFLVGSCP